MPDPGTFLRGGREKLSHWEGLTAESSMLSIGFEGVLCATGRAGVDMAVDADRIG